MSFLNIKNYTLIKIYFLRMFLPHKPIYKFILNNKKKSYSQIFQDLFVAYHFKKKNGTFIEIGAGDGKFLSNSLFLEKKYNWKGILCEPNPNHWKSIKKLRSAKLIKKIIHNKCNKKIKFYINKNSSYLSSIIKKKNNTTVLNETLCLNHLFEKNKINNIDYCSIDTEGNEIQIIKNFNFKKYNINFISIEHNFDKKKREKIFTIMKKNNYTRILKYLSYMDDWYFRN